MRPGSRRRPILTRARAIPMLLPLLQSRPVLIIPKEKKNRSQEISDGHFFQHHRITAGLERRGPRGARKTDAAGLSRTEAVGGGVSAPRTPRAHAAADGAGPRGVHQADRS